MKTIYLDDWPSGKENLELAIRLFKQAKQNHKFTIGKAAPKAAHPLIYDLLDTEFHFIEKTRQQIDYEAQEKIKIQLEYDMEEAKTKGSPKYKEFRKTEYPSPEEGLEAFVEWAIRERDTGVALPQKTEDYVNKCLAVKKKYPKPGS